MSVFNFLTRKKSSNESNLLLAMPLFSSGDRYMISEIVAHLNKFWGLEVSSISGDDDSAVFTINDETVAIGYMPTPIPKADIQAVANYAFNWPNASEELEQHSGHAIVSLSGSENTTVERFQLLSKVLCSIFSTSKAVGVYKGAQTLLIPKEQYLENVDELKENGIPVPLWIYIGLIKTNSGNSGYTFGLSAFDKVEMEVIDSTIDLEELYNFVANISAYVIGNNVTFKSGETIGYTEEQKIKITLSEGKFVNGKSIKLGL